MRLFFGLDLPATSKMRIDDWRNKTYGAIGLGVPAENFHVTLAFLGDCTDRQIESLFVAAEKISSPAFSADFDDLGYWPKTGAIWLGCRRAPPELLTLARQCRAVGHAHNLYANKKSYLPHITLWRNQDLAAPAPIVAPDFHTNFERLVLFESRNANGRKTGGSSARYRTLESWNLSSDGKA